MVIPIRDRKVLPVNAYVEGRNARTGVGLGIILEKSEVGFFVIHGAVWLGVGKVVCKDSFQVGHIFGANGLAP